MRAVPKHLKPVLGKAYLLRPIGAMSHAEAKAKAQQYAAQDAAMFSRLQKLAPSEAQELVKAGGLTRWEATQELEARFLPFLQLPETGEDFDPDAPEDIQAKQAFEVAKARKDSIQALERVARSNALKLRIKGRKPADEAALMQLISVYRRERPAVDERSFKRARLYIGRLIEHIGDIHPRQLTRDHILKFRDALEAKGYSRANVNQHLDKLGTLFSIAINCGEMVQNPAEKIRARDTTAKKTGRRKGFSEAEMKIIFEALPSQRSDFQTIIRMLAHHGMRSGELLQVRCMDVAEEHGVLIVHLHDIDDGRSIKNKKSVRKVPIHPSCQSEIIALVEDVSAKHGASAPLFQSLSAHDPARRFQREMANWIRSLGMADRKPRDFRHRFRTICGEAEMPERFSRSLMGHTLGKDVHGSYGEAPSLKSRLKWLSRIDPLEG